MQNSVSKVAGLTFVAISIALLSACAATTPSVSGGDDVVAKLSAVGIDCEAFVDSGFEGVECYDPETNDTTWVYVYPSFEAMKADRQESTIESYCLEADDSPANLALVGDNFNVNIWFTDENAVVDEDVVQAFQKALGGTVMTWHFFNCEYLDANSTWTPVTTG